MARNQTQIKTINYFARAGRTNREDMRLRAPELAPLGTRTVACFGLGCIGAPSVLELARAGIGTLRILDHDVVDPGTTLRWPFGFGAAGRKKVEVIRDFIQRDYPYTQVVTSDRRIGGTRLIALPDGSDSELLQKMMGGVSLVYDATAEFGIQHLLSEWAAQATIPYLAVDATFGGWGGRVCRIAPGRTEGCWFCYQQALCDGSIPSPPAKANGTIQPPGCGEPTFTGTGFDLSDVALAGVRMAVSTLCANEPNAYPRADWDVLIISFRDISGNLIPPKFDAYKLSRQPNCPRCSAV